MATKRPLEVGEAAPLTLAPPPTLVPPPALAVEPAVDPSTATDSPAAATSSFACPEEAGQVDHAQMWYYRDHYGMEQGPYSTAVMRSWYEAGYFEGGVTVAASYYGEVPFTYWQLGELWEVPAQQAFIPAEGVEQIAEAPVEAPEFIPSAEFAGAKEGYVFQSNTYGVGYYIDNPPEVVCTTETLAAEHLELKVKVRRATTPLACTHTHLSCRPPPARILVRRLPGSRERTYQQTWGAPHSRLARCSHAHAVGRRTCHRRAVLLRVLAWDAVGLACVDVGSGPVAGLYDIRSAHFER